MGKRKGEGRRTGIGIISGLLVAAILLAGVSPSVAADAVVVLPERLPSTRNGISAVWDGATYAYIFGGEQCGGCPVNQIVRYDPARHEVKVMGKTLPTGRHMTSAAWDGSKAYIFGGWQFCCRQLGDILRYDPAEPDSGSTPVVASLPSRRAGTSAVFDGHHFYVFGGSAAINGYGDGAPGWPLDETVRFDPRNNSVTLASPMPSPRHVTSAVWDGRDLPPACPGGCAYVFGGERDSKALGEILRYNPSSDRWSTMGARLPAQSLYTAALWIEPFAYILGGVTTAPHVATSTVLRYDPVSDTLMVADARLPTPRSNGGAFAAGPMGYYLGGQATSPGPLYDTILELAPTMLSPAVAAGAAVDAIARSEAAIRAQVREEAATLEAAVGQEGEAVRDTVRAEHATTQGAIEAARDAILASLEAFDRGLRDALGAAEAQLVATIASEHGATRGLVTSEHGATRDVVRDHVTGEHGATRGLVASEHGATRVVVRDHVAGEHGATRGLVASEHGATRDVIRDHVTGEHGTTRGLVVREHGVTRDVIRDHVAGEHGATRGLVASEHGATRDVIRDHVTGEHVTTRDIVRDHVTRELINLRSSDPLELTLLRSAAAEAAGQGPFRALVTLRGAPVDADIAATVVGDLGETTLPQDAIRRERLGLYRILVPVATGPSVLVVTAGHEGHVGTATAWMGPPEPPQGPNGESQWVETTLLDETVAIPASEVGAGPVPLPRTRIEGAPQGDGAYAVRLLVAGNDLGTLRLPGAGGAPPVELVVAEVQGVGPVSAPASAAHLRIAYRYDAGAPQCTVDHDGACLLAVPFDPTSAWLTERGEQAALVITVRVLGEDGAVMHEQSAGIPLLGQAAGAVLARGP